MIIDSCGETVLGYLQRRFPHIPRGLLEKGLRKGWVRVDGRRVRGTRDLAIGETIRVPDFFKEKTPRDTYRASAKDREELAHMEISRSEGYVYFLKPAGLAVQGGSRVGKNMDAMFRGYLGDDEELRLIHRLDSSTSGIVVVARSLDSARVASDLFMNNMVDKLYWALVYGRVDERGEINKKVDGKSAHTVYQRIWSDDFFSLVSLVPITGRKHQLRRHILAISEGIVGDYRYGKRDSDMKKVRMMLHSSMIKLGDEEVVEARPPSDFFDVLKSCGFRGKIDSSHQTWKDMKIDEKILR